MSSVNYALNIFVSFLVPCFSISHIVTSLNYDISGEDFVRSFLSSKTPVVFKSSVSRWPLHELLDDGIEDQSSMDRIVFDIFNQKNANFENDNHQFTEDGYMSIEVENEFLEKRIHIPLMLLSCRSLKDHFKQNGRVFIEMTRNVLSSSVDYNQHQMIAFMKGEMNLTFQEEVTRLTAGDLLYLPPNLGDILYRSPLTFSVKFSWPSKREFHPGHCDERPSLWALTHDLEKGDPLANWVDHTIPNLKLNSGFEMPPIGLGTARLFEKTYSVVQTALNMGYTLYDTAQIYSGEAKREGFKISSEFEIGRAIKLSKVERTQLFLLSKIDPDYMTYDETIDKAKQSLKQLQTEYLDAMLIHGFSFEGACGPHNSECTSSPWIAWKALEELLSRGLVRSIGVSNIESEDLLFLIRNYSVAPVSIVQNWFDPFHQDNDVRKICSDYNIAYMGYSTLGAAWNGERGFGFPTNPVLTHDIIKASAAESDIPASTYILRWAMEKRVVVIPCSTDPVHLDMNLASRSINIHPGTIPFVDRLNDKLGNPDDSRWQLEDFVDLVSSENPKDEL